MARRKLLRREDRAALLGVPTDEESLIRHYTLSPADQLEITIRRRRHNRLGFAIQLCLMRYPGRTLMPNEVPPGAMLDYIADQLGTDPDSFRFYAQREPTRLEHVSHLLAYLGMRTAAAPDRRAALVSAIEAASATDKGSMIARAIITTFREHHVLLPPPETIERIGLAGRAIARRRAEEALVSGFSPEQLRRFDDMLKVDPAIAQTRFHWLRSAPDAPSAGNLLAMMERLIFLRALDVDSRLQDRIHSGRWDQMIREGDVTPAWLAADFNASRRRATIIVQIIRLGEMLTDAAVTMFIKLMGRLFSKANNRKVQRHIETRKETAKVLRLFLDTILALQTANDSDEDAIETINRRVGWHRLLQVKPALEAMVENGDPDPLLVAAEHYPNIRKYAAQFLRTFSFRSARRSDPLLSAIEILKSLHEDPRRNLPDRFPVAHLGVAARKLILHDAKPDRRLYEIATLAALRERLRSADIWVEGSRAFRPIDEHLMPRPAFTDLKDSDQLGLGVQRDGAAWLADMQAALDFNLKRLAYRGRLRDGAESYAKPRTRFP